MDFIDFEATVATNNEVGSEDEVSDIDSLKSFIDDKTEVEEDRTRYHRFENSSKSVDESLAEELMKVCVKSKTLLKFQISVNVLKKKAK